MESIEHSSGNNNKLCSKYITMDKYGQPTTDDLNSRHNMPMVLITRERNNGFPVFYSTLECFLSLSIEMIQPCGCMCTPVA